eukprot:scaffold127200_cov31-Tisochrysis_lutea.AAC.3
MQTGHVPNSRARAREEKAARGRRSLYESCGFGYKAGLNRLWYVDSTDVSLPLLSLHRDGDGDR